MVTSLKGQEASSDEEPPNDSTVVEKKKNWIFAANYHLNASQVSLNSQWAGGGKSNMALATTVDMKLNFNRNGDTWENSFLLDYGRARQGGRENPFAKTTDNLIFISRYGKKIEDKLYIKTIADFRTQIDKGWRYTNLPDGSFSRVLLSNFMSPAYLLLNLGLSYSKPSEYAITLSPLAAKTIFVLNDSLANNGNFGNIDGRRISHEVGASIICSYQTKFETINYRTNLNLFARYDDLNSISAVDVNWENIITLTVNKYIKSTIATLLIWDEDIEVSVDEQGIGQTGVQFRSGINIGFSIALNKQF